MTDYNGWTNYETWNVALWIQNDEGLYECGSTETPDGVKWNDHKINHTELNDMIEEL